MPYGSTLERLTKTVYMQWEGGEEIILHIEKKAEIAGALFIRAFLAGVVPGGVFHLHPVTSLSLKVENSNFVQNYFEVGSIF